MIISIDEKKVSDKTQHTFMLKTLRKLGIKRNFLNKIKGIYGKPTANIMLSGQRLKRSATRCPFTPLLYKIVQGVLVRAISQGKK